MGMLDKVEAQLDLLASQGTATEKVAEETVVKVAEATVVKVAEETVVSAVEGAGHGALVEVTFFEVATNGCRDLLNQRATIVLR
jgi:hypothetical protein